MVTVGVFDSGIGGLSVANTIQRQLPKVRILYANDTKNVPYGDKTPAQLRSFVLPILQDMVDGGAQIIVIACNTVTTTIISELRAKISVPIIGIEPMVKPAALATKTGTIAVCATPGTLKSERYNWLKQTYAANVHVIEPLCNQWAYMIEHNQINEKVIRSQVKEMCSQDVDVIVLGCTHYHWIEDVISDAAGSGVIVMQPESVIVERVKHELEKLS